MFPLIAITFLTACSGQMNGVIRDTGQTVKLNFEQGIDSDILTAQLDGEIFSGKSVMENQSSTFSSAFGTAFGGGTNSNFGSQIFSQTTSGNFMAVLFGDKGSTIRCQLRYADSSGMTSMGGVGQCIHSDSRIIDILW